MRPLPIVLTVLVVAIQYPLWLGKGGWVRVWELDRQLDRQYSENAGLNLRNAALEGEVADLKRGLHAIEERARYELGMVRPDEVYVQINPSGDAGSPVTGRGLGVGATPSAGRDALRTADVRGLRPEAEPRRDATPPRRP